MADKITPEMMQKIQELQVPPVTLDCHSAIWTISNHLGGLSSHSLCAFFVGRWSLCIDPGEISGFHSERDWLPATDYVHVSILLRLHAGRQRLPRSYFLRVRQCQFKHFRWGTRRLIHVGYTFRILIETKKKHSCVVFLTRSLFVFSRISVLYNIMSNTFIPVEYKQRLRSAARIGRDFQQCNRYDCPALSESSSRF
jgi:hypothetical protein